MPKARVSGKPLTAAQRAQRSVAAKASAAKRKKGFAPIGKKRALAQRVSNGTDANPASFGKKERTKYGSAVRQTHPLGAGVAQDGAMHARVSSVGTVKDPNRQVKANKRYKSATTATVVPAVTMPIGTSSHTVHPPSNHPMGAGPPMDGAMHNRIKATTPPRNGVHETDTGTGVKRVKYKNGKAVGASFVKHTSTGRDYRTF